METMSRSVLPSPSLARYGTNPVPVQKRTTVKIPSLMRRRREKDQDAVVPLLLRVRAKAVASVDEKKHTLGFLRCESEVKGVFEEIREKVVGVHLVAGVSVAVAFLVAFTHVDSASARSGEIDLPPIEPEVVTVSSSKEISLAKQLQVIGAKMYGAFWCSHCFEQKQMFGKEALKYIEYVECYPEGYRRGVKLAPACSAANIQGFPTWVINGQKYSGEQGFDKLAELSGLPVAQVMK
ncbi:hypothetical protein M758_6G155100 [Ceratodon purpureus]|nr:hypothetical protein M758_6G155100 [Ceratodon purpureus]